ncbi:MAG: methyltransferase domain-containing protein [Anaerolineales bacterium]|nr:methyltransferase domain-containing protein [Anaerolineales bacterium]
MTDHKIVYQQEGDLYQRLIGREDYLGNLLPELKKITPLKGKDVVDLGSGTGRLVHLLAPHVKSVHALDLFTHMLGVAAGRLQNQQLGNWQVTAGDHRQIPLPNKSADLVVSCWSICYLVVWEGEEWKREVESALLEMKRVLRSGGTMIIIETLGTGNIKPVEKDDLKPYFAFLESRGFQRSWIRTDYRFDSREEALELVEFFFGEEMVGEIGNESKPILPECTGLWWLKI